METLDVVGGLLVPARHIVEESATRPHDRQAVLLLLLGEVGVADEGRVAHDVVALLRGHHVFPAHAQGVCLHDAAVVGEGQLVVHAAHHLGRVHVGLLLGNPKRGARHAAGEVVDLDAVEVGQAHAHGRGLQLLEGEAQVLLATQLKQDAILQLAQLHVGLREEVARAARRVEEGERPQLCLQCLQRLGPRAACHGQLQGAGQLGLQAIEEKRVYQLVDGLGRGVVHAARAALVVAERPLEDGTEHGGRHARPVELLAAVDDEFCAQCLIYRGHLHALGEEAAVHVGEGLEGAILHVEGVALGVGRVEPHEEVGQGLAQALGTRVAQEVAEGAGGDEPGVLAEHEEHEPRADDGERVVHLGRVRVHHLGERGGQHVVHAAHEGARLHRHLVGQHRRGVAPGEKAQGVQVARKVGQGHLEHGRLGAEGVAVAVVGADGGEVAGEHPAGLLV